MKVFEPLITYSSPSSTAVVFTPCRSEPAPGSVMAIAVTISPETSFRQVFVLQRFAAVMQDVRRDDVRMQGKTDAGQAKTTDLFDHHRAVKKVRPQPAVRFRQVRAQHPRLPCLVPEFTVDVALFLPLRMKRHRLFFEERSHAVAKNSCSELNKVLGIMRHLSLLLEGYDLQRLSLASDTGHWTHPTKNKTIQPSGDHFPL